MQAVSEKNQTTQPN